MRTLDVYLGDELIGYIEENRKGGRFVYTKQTIEKLVGRPVLSLAFPAKARPFDESKTSNWFNGLLPEGARRDEACRSLGIAPHDWIGLLSQIGWECAGAVRIFEHDDKQAHDARYEKIDAAELAQKLSSISARSPRLDSRLFRMSLGGFQEKLCVSMPPIPQDTAHIQAEGVLLPIGDAPSTHILKPENTREYLGTAQSEAWAMTAAAHAAKTSRVALLSIDNAPETLVVERYDRKFCKGSRFATRLHQEDICQALGLSPEEKYANTIEPKGNDPTYIAIAALLQKFATNPQREKVELLRQLTVNLALGNWDSHAKNIALLYREPMVPALAPLYDVVPVAEVEPRTDCLSLRVNGLIRPEQVLRKDVISEAVSWGLEEDEALAVLDETLKKLQDGIHAASDLYPEAGKRHEARTLKRIKKLKAH